MDKQKNVLNRRSFVSSVGLLGLAGLTPLPAEAFTRRDNAGFDSQIIKTLPYLQSVRGTEATVRWITRGPCNCWVEYGESPDKLDRKAAPAVVGGLITAYNTVHAITLSDLSPGREYYYRIASNVIEDFQPYKVTFGETFVSDTYSFRTPDPKAKKVSFLVFNDIHDRPDSFAHLMKYNGQDKVDFVFLNGDMFNYQTDEDQLVNHLFNPLGELFSTTTPFIFSRGNHETRGKFARQIADYFNHNGAPYYFSFQQGPMYAIVLDSGEDKTDGDKEYFGLVSFDEYRLEQARWLKKEVQKEAFRKARYKVVFSHIPFYYSGDWHGTTHCREIFGPILNEAKVDLLISGHTHRYGIHPKVEGKHNYPIVIGGGPKDGARTLMKIVANEKSFELNMFGDSGDVVGKISL